MSLRLEHQSTDVNIITLNFLSDLEGVSEAGLQIVLVIEAIT